MQHHSHAPWHYSDITVIPDVHAWMCYCLQLQNFLTEGNMLQLVSSTQNVPFEVRTLKCFKWVMTSNHLAVAICMLPKNPLQIQDKGNSSIFFCQMKSVTNMQCICISWIHSELLSQRMKYIARSFTLSHTFKIRSKSRNQIK